MNKALLLFQNLKKNKEYFLFSFILIIGLYLRFWNYEHTTAYGWDQARDAWKVRDILLGQIVLNGPRTGIGHFFLGPLWYYILVPFYAITHLDPIGALYANIVVNIFDFVAVFYVAQKIFNKNAALFAIFLLATSQYLIEIMKTSWNVSPVIGVSALIFYCIYQIVYKNIYSWIPLLFFLTGMFFHLHFSFVFLPFIIFFSFIFVTHKKKILKRSLLSLPMFFIWFIPTIVYELQSKNSNSSLFATFMKEYSIPSFHLKFFLFRLHDGFIQFKTVLHVPDSNIFLFLSFQLFLLLQHVFQKIAKIDYLLI
jgi:4-amino-4-deoxy-L-arabinose transferase-like glycosyltransferase